MNKKELIAIVSEKTNLNNKICKQVFEEVIDVVKNCFYTGQIVSINMFGKFSYKEIKPRKRYIPSLKGVKVFVEKYCKILTTNNVIY